MSLIFRPAFLNSVALLSGFASLGCNASFQASIGGADEPETPVATETSASAPQKDPPATESKADAAKEAAEAAKQAEKEAAASVKLKGDSLIVNGNLVFDLGKSTLTNDAINQTLITQLSAYLNQNPKITQVRIEGHTDDVGDDTSNLELSGQRALAAKTALAAAGVAESRLVAVGFGETKPLASNDTPEGRAQNRRTEFKLAGLKGKNYLGLDPLGGGTEFK